MSSAEDSVGAGGQLPAAGALDRSAHLPGGRNRRDWPLQQPFPAIRDLAAGSRLMIA